MQKLALIACLFLTSCASAPPRAVINTQHEINAVRYVADDISEDVPASVSKWQGVDHFKKVGGDCEEFAMAKCEALSKKGHDCKIVIGWMPDRKIHHAVALVDNMYWLDNLKANRSSYNQPKGFEPIGSFTIN